MTHSSRERATTLERTLGLGSVILTGLAYMAPMIVLGTFGVVAEASNGTVPTAYLVTLIAMLLTAYSYGRMALAKAGAELLVTISAKMEPFGNDHAVFVSARALENGLPHAYVNQVGPGEGITFVGESTVVSQDGDVIARAGRPDETVLGARLLFPATSDLRQDYLSELRSPMPGVENVSSGERLKA